MQIIAPPGGFMNHMRWLMWLTIDQPFYHHSVIYPEEDVYLLAHRDGWPDTLKEFNNLSYEDLPSDAIINPKNKVEFISKEVYPMERNKQNWLEYEWKFRNRIEIFCKLMHSIDEINKNEKAIIMRVSAITANNHYMDMNTDSQAHTSKLMEKFYNNIMPTWLEISSEKLLNEVLDEELYNTATEYFGIDNNYKDAKIVHKLWYARIK